MHSHRRKQLKQARGRGASEEVLEKMGKTDTTGDCIKKELLIINLDDDLDTCPIKEHYNSNFVVALSALKASMKIGLEHLNLGDDPSNRQAQNEIQSAVRQRIYGSFVSTERSENSLAISVDDVCDEKYEITVSSSFSSHSYELVDNEQENCRTTSSGRARTLSSKLKRQASKQLHGFRRMSTSRQDNNIAGQVKIQM